MSFFFLGKQHVPYILDGFRAISLGFPKKTLIPFFFLKRTKRRKEGRKEGRKQESKETRKEEGRKKTRKQERRKEGKKERRKERRKEGRHNAILIPACEFAGKSPFLLARRLHESIVAKDLQRYQATERRFKTGLT